MYVEQTTILGKLSTIGLGLMVIANEVLLKQAGFNVLLIRTQIGIVLGFGLILYSEGNSLLLDRASASEE